MKTYSNPWIPQAALEILKNHTGTLLDFGGGAAPFHKATHLMDLSPFDANRLVNNAWGGVRTVPWKSTEYTQWDACDGRPWPFADKQFDLGLSSHTLEDMRDPLPAVRELARVSKQVLIITPSRLMEQTLGSDRPRFCGFSHHPWMVEYEGDRVIFRRKTQFLYLRRAHVKCSIGKTLVRELGSSFYYGKAPVPVDATPHSDTEEYNDLVRFASQYRGRRDIFMSDGRKHTLRFLFWRWRQKYLASF